MLSKEKCGKLLRELQVRFAIEGDPANTIAALHIKDKHLVDIHAALDHSSRTPGDHGVDAWHLDEKAGELFIYQSKFTESKALTLQGLSDLDRARDWLESVLVAGEVERVPQNPCLYGLYARLAQKPEIKKLTFVLLSMFDKGDLEDHPDCDAFVRKLQQSKLMPWLVDRGAKINFYPEAYDLDVTIAPQPTLYPVRRLRESSVQLRNNACLDLAYVSLRSLVDLYRQRGNTLFDKNVRLSVLHTKETKERLGNPMQMTLEQICDGELSPAIFPFYHVGVTVRAASNQVEGDSLCLEAPSIINGCQTISIATHFFKTLERDKANEKILRFNQIQVVAKVVTGTTDEELKEITNSNNRQIPIENWQLFSNDPIQVEIGLALESIGVFYERQKGRFQTMQSVDVARRFPNTNNAFISVVELGQVVALARRNLQWAAKPSEIFINKRNHDRIFDRQIPAHPHDMVWACNMQKALRRGLENYLRLPSYQDERSDAIFRKPIVKAHLHYAGLVHFYQNSKKSALRMEYGRWLSKKASTTLVQECETFYQRIVAKMKQWYLDESKNFKARVSSKQMESFLQSLCIELGLDVEAEPMPFDSRAHDWKELREEGTF